MGKNSAPPPLPTPMEQSQAQLVLQQQQQQEDRERIENQRAYDAQQAATERQRVEAQTAQKNATSAAMLNNTYNTGTAYGRDRVGGLGFDDTFNLMGQYTNELNAARSRVPEGASDPGSYFDYNSIWDNVYNRTETNQRNQLDNQFRDATPLGWTESRFADTADDKYLDEILNNQYQETFDTVDAARARGQMGEGAFTNTLAGMDTKRISSRSMLEDMGLGVLGGYRDQLSDIGNQFSDRISNYRLGQNLNMDEFNNYLDTRTSSLNGRLKGDIYRMVGDQQFFNPDTLMAKGAARAGVSNNPLRNAFQTEEDDPTRTTGTTGVF